MSFHDILHVILHGCLDSLKLLPFLFLTYLLMELLEHKAGDRVQRAVSKAGRAGPLVGALLGLVPQCGFSALAAGLFAARIVTPGTVLAVFLATSDEMLPIFLGAGLPVSHILRVLGIKLAVAALGGFLTDLLFCRGEWRHHVARFCDEEHCHCEKGIWRSALHHTVHIFAFVLTVNILLGGVLELVGTQAPAGVMRDIPVLGQSVAALIGLIPNCAASVAVATLYTKGMISAGAMLAGLLTGAGAGLLVLFRTNRHLRENLLFVAALLGIGLAVGLVIDLTGAGVALGL